MRLPTRLLTVGMMMVMAAGALAADAGTPRAMGEKLIADVLTVLRNPKLSKPEKQAGVEKIANESMDFETLARISLGAPWKNLNADQKKTYVEEFRQHVINTYRHTTDEYTDEDIKVTSDRMETDGDATVLTQIIGTQDNGVRGEVAKVSYRLRKRGDGWKVIDVNIDGVSLVTNFRSQFREIIANGNVDKLIKLLHDKNAEADKEKAAGK